MCEFIYWQGEVSMINFKGSYRKANTVQSHLVFYIYIHIY